MSAKTTIIAAVILAALAAYIYRYEREPVESDVESKYEKIFSFEAEKILEIEIRRPEAETVRLRRTSEEAWQLVSPIDFAADEVASRSLANAASSLERERVVALGEVDLADFGLDAPQLELELKLQDVEVPTILLMGSETPTGSNLYARLAEGNEIFVMASSSKYALEKSVWDLRDRLILHFSRDDVETVVLEQSGKRVVLARASEDLWNVAEPALARADRYKTSGLVSMLETAKMEELVSESGEDLASYGLSSPSYQVEIQLKGGRSETLLVGAQKDTNYYARNPDRSLIYLIGQSVADEIKKDETEYLSKRLFDFATYQVNKLQIASADGSTRIYEKSKEDEQDVWKETAPQARDMDRTKVDDLLYKLNSSDAAETVTEGPGLDNPKYTITVWSQEGANAEELAVGQPVGDAVYAHRKGEELFLKLAATSWGEIEKVIGLEDVPAPGED